MSRFRGNTTISGGLDSVSGGTWEWIWEGEVLAFVLNADYREIGELMLRKGHGFKDWGRLRGSWAIFHWHDLRSDEALVWLVSAWK